MSLDPFIEGVIYQFEFIQYPGQFLTFDNNKGLGYSLNQYPDNQRFILQKKSLS
jgi:hypothetical protein